MHRPAAVNSFALMTSVAVLACMSSAPSARADLRVVVTSKPVHSLVAGVMGTTGQPGLLVSGSSSPHTYAMKPSDAKAVNAASLFFRVSEELEPFTAKLVKSLPSAVRVVTLADAPGLELLNKREGGAFEAHDVYGKNHGGHDHSKPKKQAQASVSASGADAHIWLNPDNAIALVAQISAVLSEADPEQAAVYAGNARRMTDEIKALAAELKPQLAPVASVGFIAFHDAYQYFEAWAGLSAVGSITTNPDVPPTGKRLSALRARIAGAQVRCVFAEPQFQPKIITALTEGLTVRTATLDPEGTLLAPGPELYSTLMRTLSASITGCLNAP